MDTSSSIKEISKALFEFQKKVGPIFRDQTANINLKDNKKMQYKFADLAAIQAVINEPLLECGLIIIQDPIGKYNLETTIIHVESGEYISSCYEMIPAGNTPQAQGSTITYQKRYALIAMLNLMIKDDDDAKKGSERTKNEQLASKPFLKTAKQLDEDSKKDDFYSRLYRAERATYEAHKEWSLREFLSGHYEFTSAIIAKVEDEYFEYKVKKSLP